MDFRYSENDIRPTMKFCLARHCNNSSRTTPDKTFFSLPEDIVLRKCWLKAVSCNVPLRIYNMYVCEDHFDLQSALDRRYSDSKVLRSGVSPQIFEHSTNPGIEAEHQNIVENTENLNANTIPKENNVQETNNLDDAFSLFVKSVVANLKEMPVERRLKVKNRIETIMKRGSVLNL